MIPRLAEGGASFKGAALYYLHDKREEGEIERGTSARVAWTYALNLPTQDPDRAWRMMAHTAMNQADLKAAAGVKATGRKLTKPVMAYSLAWSPDEPPPAPHEMLEAAQESLAALGLELHQALVICHNDTPHPHVHVVVNRVSPENGIAHNGSKAKLKLSAWAEDYEQRQGRILCVERVQNNKKRRDPAQPNPKPEPKVSRPHWEADQVDLVEAGAVAAHYQDRFSEQAAAERAGADRRFKEQAEFHARRRAGRNAIRDRYQAALDASRDPKAAAVRAWQADALLRADPGLGLVGLTRDRSTFTRQDLVRHVARHTANVQDFQAVLDRLETSPELVRVGRDDQGRQRFTTREHRALERRMLETAEWLHASTKREIRPLWPEKMSLSRDQEQALRYVVEAKGLAAIVGYAGTGKSTLLGAARRSWEAAGLAVHGMTLSGIAADGLKQGSGIDSRTIQSRLRQWEQGINRPGRNDVIVVDEAGMIGSRQMERILHYAAEGEAKVVLVGDPEQLQAIEAGGAFRKMVDRFGAAELNSVRRQRAEWQQEATRELATGRTAQAIDRYDAAGMLHGHRTTSQAKAALIEEWRQIRAAQPAATQLILAYNNAEVRDLNERARAVMKEAGALGTDTTVTTANGRRNFAAGDRIYFLKNDAGLGVRNGTLATVIRIERQTMIVRLDGEEGRQVMFGMKSYSHVDHGYAATVHKSQGVTVDRAHLLATRSLDRHATYVAMTRHRDRLDVHWSEEAFKSAAKFRRDVGRAAVKDTSLDYGDGEVPPPAAAPAPDRQDRPESRQAQTLRQQWDPPRQPDRPAVAPEVRAAGISRPPVPPATKNDFQAVAARLDALRSPLRRHWTNIPHPSNRPNPARSTTIGQGAFEGSRPPAGSPAMPDKPPTTAERLEALRLAAHGRRPSQAKPVNLIRRVGDRALARLQRAVAERNARQPARDPAPRPTSTTTPHPVLPPPRPEDLDRVSIVLTAEMLAYDHETAALSAAMTERHQAEISQEQDERAMLIADAAVRWTVAGIERDEPEQAPDPSRHRPPPALDFDL